jgi:hypothetical protein
MAAPSAADGTHRSRSSRARHADSEQLLREDAEREQRKAVGRQEPPVVGARLDGRRVGGVVEVHELDDPQIVERADERRDHRDHGQPDESRIDRRLDHGELRVEADRRGKAGERETSRAASRTPTTASAG